MHLCFDDSVWLANSVDVGGEFERGTSDAGWRCGREAFLRSEDET